MKKVDKCSACDGDVVEEQKQEFDPTTSPAIIGSGSLVQYKTITSYFCAACGIVYKAPPKVMKKRLKAHGVEISNDDLPQYLKDMIKHRK